jgi:hypothetical protein
LGIDVWCLLCVFAVLCLGRGLATSWSLVQKVLPTVNWSGNWKEAKTHKGCRAIRKKLYWWKEEDLIMWCVNLETIVSSCEHMYRLLN